MPATILGVNLVSFSTSGSFFGPFLGVLFYVEYLGLWGVETYYLFKNSFGALFGAFFRALFNDTELTPWPRATEEYAALGP